MVRTWIARPDVEIDLLDGRVMQIVSREAQAQALLDALTMQERAGGVIEAIADRKPTEFPGEMVTVLYVVTWKDRTDAKAQPEAPQVKPGAAVAVPRDPADMTPEEMEAVLEAEAAETDAEARFLAEAEQGEDESAMEPSAR